MRAVAALGCRVGGSDDHHRCRGDDEDELPAVAPREVHGMPVRFTDPPAVAIRVAAPAGRRARHPGAIDPRAWKELAAVGSAAPIEIEAPECKHLPWRHPHLVPAEEHPLWI